MRGSLKQFVEALVAIRFAFVLFKSSFVQLLQTERANEMFRMKFFAHSRYTFTTDRFVATST